MGRRNLRKVRWKLLISEEIAAAVEELIWDPVLRKPKYGGRSEVVEFLLRHWIDNPEILPPEFIHLETLSHE
jgi:hypothetical protein